MQSIDFLTGAYAFFNSLRLVSYIPQIIAVARDRHGAVAVSIVTWLVWVGANGTTALYAGLKLGDLPLALLNGFNTVCCAIVLGIVIYKRAIAGLLMPSNLIKNATIIKAQRALGSGPMVVMALATIAVTCIGLLQL